jgi:hypothetical protein
MSPHAESSPAPAYQEALAKFDIHQMDGFAVPAPKYQVPGRGVLPYHLVRFLAADRTDNQSIFQL